MSTTHRAALDETTTEESATEESATTETPVQSEPARVAIAGDWHANTVWAVRCLRHLDSLGVREVFQLGDFGIWPGQKGKDYITTLEQTLEELDMRVVVTPGNHEDYHQIAQLPVENRDRHRAHAGFEELGAVQWAGERIALLPRGHRFTSSGWEFVSLGGAASVDFEHRTPGVSWWIEEMITDDDLATVVQGGAADVMLTHEAPEPWHGTDAVAEILRTPSGRSAEVLAYAGQGRRRLDEAFQAVRPQVLAHGHYHVKGTKRLQVPGWGHQSLVVSTECDQMPDANLAILHLPPTHTSTTDPQGADSGTQDTGISNPGSGAGGARSGPWVEWVPLPPARIGVDRSQLGLWPQRPVWAWETEQFHQVLTEGRSAHWAQLISEAIEEPEAAWVARLRTALAQAGPVQAAQVEGARVWEYFRARAPHLLPETDQSTPEQDQVKPGHTE